MLVRGIFKYGKSKGYTQLSMSEFFGDLELPNNIFEKKLTNRKEFIKVHRSYIVNMDCILSLKKSEIITYNNKKVPVSRLLYNDIKQKYVEYLFGDGGKSL